MVGKSLCGRLIALKIQVINCAKMSLLRANSATIRRQILSQVLIANALGKVKSMRLMIAALLATASFLSPINGFAQSADVESTISKVDENGLTITLSDGKNYKVPEEFNFEGLKAGVKVVVFYTEVDGKRVVDDLEVVQ
jgi:Cu/Ag efflux protein CusF